MRPGEEQRLPDSAEDRMAGHTRCRIRASGVVTVDEHGLSCEVLFVDRVVWGIDDEARARGTKRPLHEGAQAGIRREPEGEPVIHRHGVG